MPTIARLNQAYSSVNMIGHLQDSKLGMQAHVNQMVARGFQGRNLRGFAAVRNRSALNMHFLLAGLQTADRIMSPLHGIQLAMHAKQGLRLAQPSMYPLAELAFGRGQ